MALILITHDMGVVAETADRVVVQYKGKKMEEADVLSLFESPQNPYTRALLATRPSVTVGLFVHTRSRHDVSTHWTESHPSQSESNPPHVPFHPLTAYRPIEGKRPRPERAKADSGRGRATSYVRIRTNVKRQPDSATSA